MITCFIRYEIKATALAEFERYAQNWGEIIPRCGGHLIGYFLPHEGCNTEAYGLIRFLNLAAYEQYRHILQHDEKAKENFAFAQAHGFILKEERHFLKEADKTFLIEAKQFDTQRVI